MTKHSLHISNVTSDACRKLFFGALHVSVDPIDELFLNMLSLVRSL